MVQSGARQRKAQPAHAIGVLSSPEGCACGKPRWEVETVFGER